MSVESLSTERVVTLARAAHEHARFASTEQKAAEKAANTAVQSWNRGEPNAVDALLVSGAKTRGGAGAGAAAADGGAVERLMKERASLQLQLQTANDGQSEIQAKLKREQADHAEALSTMGLQRKKLKELEDERRTLLSRIDESDTKLRQQVNETETAKLQFERLKAERQTVSNMATGQAEETSRLRDEVTRLKAELEQARKERTYAAASAQQQVVAAEGQTADAAFVRLWEKMSKEMPEVFVPTHVANEKTFVNVCDAMLELCRAFRVIELHVHHYLRDLRQVSEQNDPLNRWHGQLTKAPGVLQTLRDLVSANKSISMFRQTVRVLQAWSRAFTSGIYKVIVRAPDTIGRELNPRDWPVKGDAAIGKHLREVAVREIPEKLGTALRKQAGASAHEDYNELVKS